MSIASAPFRCLKSALLMSAIGSALAGCATSYVAVDRQPSATLLLPRQDPELVADPETASRAEINIERVNVSRACADCRERHQDLVTFVKGGEK